MSQPNQDKQESVEQLSAEIHKCYCRAYERRFGEPYWTGGDYSKLDEAVKDYDREMARFMLEAIQSERSKADALRQRIDELEHRVEVCQKFHGEKL